MKIADIYIDVGLKGKTNTARDLSDLRHGVLDIKSGALAATAALIETFRQLHSLTAEALASGLGLQQFSQATGLSADSLQRWNYLALSAGASAQDMQGAVKNIQSAMAELALTGKVPDKFFPFAEAEKLTTDDLKDPFKILEHARHYAQTHKDNMEITRQILGPILGSDPLIAAFANSKVDLNKVPSAYLYSHKQVSGLAQDEVQLQKLGSRWQHFLGKLTAEHGGSIIKDISDFSTAIMSLVTALDGLADKLHIFDFLQSGFEAGAEATNGLGGVIKWLTKQLPEGGTRALTDNLLTVEGEAAVRDAAKSVHQNVTNNFNTTVNGVHDAHEVPGHLKREFNRAGRDKATGGQQN